MHVAFGVLQTLKSNAKKVFLQVRRRIVLLRASFFLMIGVYLEMVLHLFLHLFAFLFSVQLLKIQF